MSGPKRIQMTRQQPWRDDNPTAVIVARGPGRKWGNPFQIIPSAHHRGCFHIDACSPDLEPLPSEFAKGIETARECARDLFEDMMRAALLSPAGPQLRAMMDEELRGRDLACWCPLDGACHADVLLEIANEAPEGESDADLDRNPAGDARPP